MIVMGLRIIGTTSSGGTDPAALALAEAAKATADDALTKAANARQMVLNRDPKLDKAAEDAAAAVVTMGQLQQALAEIVLTPGPQGERGSQGIAGPAGTANLAIAARPAPSIANGATSAAIVMPLSRTMPDTTYQLAFAHTSATTTTAAVYTVTAKTTTSVTITIRGTVALGAGTVYALAW